MMLKSLCVSSYVLKCVWFLLCCVSMILYFVCECVGRCGCLLAFMFVLNENVFTCAIIIL